MQIIINSHASPFEFYGYFHATLPVEYIQNILRVTRGHELGPFEKMAKPFDFPTWVATIATFLGGFMIIFIISFTPKFVKKFVFGAYVRDPTLSMIQIFFGIGLVRAPGRNFSRFMFAMFTIFCLIIRTACQGKMFDFLFYDEKQPSAESFSEIAERQIPLKILDSPYYDNNDGLKTIW